MLKKKIWANIQRIIELFTKKIVKKLLKIWSWDPGSGIPDPGVKKEPYPGYGSATLVDCFFTTEVHSLTVDKVIFHIFSTCRRQRGAAEQPHILTVQYPAHTVAATGAIFFFGGGEVESSGY